MNGKLLVWKNTLNRVPEELLLKSISIQKVNLEVSNACIRNPGTSRSQEWINHQFMYLEPMRTKDQSIEALRQDTPGTEHVIHFNNAGCALPTRQTLEAIRNYQDREALYGGYEVMAEYADQIKQTHREIATLIQAREEDIALTENASSSFNRALYAFDWKPGEVLLTSDIEYGNNYLNYLWLKEKWGIEIKIIESGTDGRVDPADFARSITAKTRMIAVTHMPTNSGIIYDVAGVGEIARQYGISYLVDACQTAGQLPLNVSDIGCDFLCATSRKYLRGPRGFGFLYVNPDILPKIKPQWLDMHAATWSGLDSYEMDPSAKMFEQWEVSYGNMMGLSAAVAYANELGPDFIWQRIHYLAKNLRQALTDIPGISLHDRGSHLGGIVSFTVANQHPKVVKETLGRQNINTSLSPAASSFLDMQRKGLLMVNRASVHYYNTEEEISQLAQALMKWTL